MGPRTRTRDRVLGAAAGLVAATTLWALTGAPLPAAPPSRPLHPAASVTVPGPAAASTPPSAVPAVVFTAYRDAAAAAPPRCGLDWSVLAAIGQAESGHARGGRVAADGRTLTPLLGPVLDGSGGTAVVPDSDDGRLDGDPVHDRAVGPLQFLPSAWALAGVDGSGDGAADPHNVRDAATTAARLLCGSGGDLRTSAGLRDALHTYNHDDGFARLVTGLAAAYAGAAPAVVHGETGGNDALAGSGTRFGGDPPATTGAGAGAPAGGTGAAPGADPATPVAPDPATPRPGSGATPPAPGPADVPHAGPAAPHVGPAAPAGEGAPTPADPPSAAPAESAVPEPPVPEPAADPVPAGRAASPAVAGPATPGTTDCTPTGTAPDPARPATCTREGVTP
ncbi:lytic transglycosylase domain-containing protein [Pseudonocardia alni]|uniref:lytic transglycosylase domain-containing protein n=1 Tax=Pseudonocardia alni TaxID=33907 RepID=UPI003328C1FF